MRIGLTWAPSSGKTSVVDELQRRGFDIFSEAATQIIRYEQSQWRKVVDIVIDATFQDKIHTLKLAQYIGYQKWRNTIFDTTFVDDIAHRRAGWADISPILDTVGKNLYDVIFFLEHPWIVEHNGIRIESSSEVLKLDELKRAALEEFGYHFSKLDILRLDGTEAVLVPVFSDIPNISDRIKTRADFIERLMASK
jgi:predicted ATPase